MKKTTYTASAPDGTIWERRSARDYTHAIIGLPGFGENPDGWRCIGFSGSFENATKTAKTWSNPKYGWRHVEVIDATRV